MPDKNDIVARTREAFRAAREPTGERRPHPARPVGDDVAYSRRLQESWDRNHSVTGYRGAVASPPGPDLDRPSEPRTPEWQRLKQDGMPWPENADPQASPGKPKQPWE